MNPRFFLDGTALLVAAFDLEPLGFAQPESERFYDQLLERVSALPAVEAAGLAYRTLPWTDRSGRELRNSVVVWQPDPEFARVELGGYVGGDFFQALGLEVLEGRGFIASDREGRPQVALVTEANGATRSGAPSS